MMLPALVTVDPFKPNGKRASSSAGSKADPESIGNSSFGNSFPEIKGG